MPNATVQVNESLFRTKSLEALKVGPEEDGKGRLKRTLGPASLVGLGIGAIVGAGLFSLTGVAAGDNAGPAVVLSFVIAAIGCGLAGVCYSELASMIPRAGSAYTYAYATLGELVAWIIGWDLVLEYAVGAATVAVSWSRYAVSLLQDWGVALPARFIVSPWAAVKLADGTEVHGLINLPAIAVIAVISILLMGGIGESARVNNVLVVVKLAVIALVIGFGIRFVKAGNFHPFIPENTGHFGEYGWSGIMRGAGTIFFAYIGFDAVSTAAQESRNPRRDMPIGILGSLAICTVLYILFGLVLTGIVNYHDLRGDAAPVATAIDRTGIGWLQTAVKIGIIAGSTTVILVNLLGQSRVFYAMAEDRLLPGVFARIHPRWRTPYLSNLLFMIFTSLFAGFLPIEQLGHMTSIGTLLAFVIVCAGVVVLRRTAPQADRGYRAPGVPTVPALGILVCLAMMVSLDAMTWVRLFVWMAIGLLVFFAYGRRHARVAADAVRLPHPPV